MNSQERLELSKLIKEYNVEDTTSKIRELKHSKYIKNDIISLENLKTQYSRLRLTKKEQFRSMAENRCSFLYNKYTNIFNKLYNDELNLEIMGKFIDVLERIENGEIDQHEGSYMVGTLLKDLFIDSALKHENKFNNNKNQNSKKSKKSKYKKAINNISWNDFKKMK